MCRHWNPGPLNAPGSNPRCKAKLVCLALPLGGILFKGASQIIMQVDGLPRTQICPVSIKR